MPLNPEDVAEVAARMQISPATARRYMREQVTLPDGRVITGHAPGASAVTLPEHDLRDRLAKQLGGITEASLPFGLADVLTANTVFEVEPCGSWRHGVRQALAYSAQTDLPPAVALFGRGTPGEVLKLYKELGGNWPPIGLWWWTGYTWTQVTSRRSCRFMPHWPPVQAAAR